MRTKKKTSNETITTTVNPELMGKFRVIAMKENLSINTLFDIGMRLAVKKYEQKFGEITVPTAKNIPIEEMFDLK